MTTPIIHITDNFDWEVTRGKTPTGEDLVELDLTLMAVVQMPPAFLGGQPVQARSPVMHLKLVMPPLTALNVSRTLTGQKPIEVGNGTP